MTRPKSRVVLADVAREANVSAATASAVLHSGKGNNSRYSEATARAVRAAAEKLGYRANRTYRNLNSKRHGAIGAVHAPGSYLSSYTVSAMGHEASRRDLMLVVSDAEGREPIFLTEDAVDGVVVFGEIEAKFQRRIDKLGIPALHVNTNRRDEPGTITFDEAGGMAQAVDHLAQRGRGRLILIERRPTPDGHAHYSTPLRRESLGSSCERHGLAPPRIHQLQAKWAADLRSPCESSEPVIREMMDILGAAGGCDAVILNYRILAPALYEAARRLGLDVPGDLSVIAVNTFDPIDHAWPFLTSITIDFEDLGRTIVGCLAEGIEHGPGAVDPVTFPMHLVVRESS